MSTMYNNVLVYLIVVVRGMPKGVSVPVAVASPWGRIVRVVPGPGVHGTYSRSGSGCIVSAH
jgi:hypothetical protein